MTNINASAAAARESARASDGKFGSQDHTPAEVSLGSPAASEPSTVLTGNTKRSGGRTLHEVAAARDLPHAGVKAGDVGGWVESETLKDGSPRIKGDAWLGPNAELFDQGTIEDNAIVTGMAAVYGNGRVAGNARVSGGFGRTIKATVRDNAVVDGDAQLFKGVIEGRARVTDSAIIRSGWAGERAVVRGNGGMNMDASAHGSTVVEGGLSGVAVDDHVHVKPGAFAFGGGRITGKTVIEGDLDTQGKVIGDV